MVETKLIKEHVPPAYLRPCPPKQRGPLPKVENIVNRLTYTEGALDVCAAQIRKILNWNQEG